MLKAPAVQPTSIARTICRVSIIKRFVMTQRVIILDLESSGVYKAGPMWPYESEIWPYVRHLALLIISHRQVGYQIFSHGPQSHNFGL